MGRFSHRLAPEGCCTASLCRCCSGAQVQRLTCAAALLCLPAQAQQRSDEAAACCCVFHQSAAAAQSSRQPLHQSAAAAESSRQSFHTSPAAAADCCSSALRAAAAGGGFLFPVSCSSSPQRLFALCFGSCVIGLLLCCSGSPLLQWPCKLLAVVFLIENVCVTLRDSCSESQPGQAGAATGIATGIESKDIISCRRRRHVVSEIEEALQPTLGRRWRSLARRLAAFHAHKDVGGPVGTIK
jgi:hypothetical protein